MRPPITITLVVLSPVRLLMDMSSLFQIIKLARCFAAYLMALLSALKDARLFLQLAKQTSPCSFQRAPTDYFCPSFSSWLIPHLPLDNSCQTFCTKSTVSISGLVGPMVSVATTQLCHHSSKQAVGDPYTNGHGWLSIKLYLWTLAFEFSHSFHVA